MSTFSKNNITIKGAVAIAALIAGGTLEFTRIAVGDGEIPGDKTAMTMTDLSHRLFDVTIRDVYSDTESQATVTGIFSNAQTQTGFYYREIGLFAKDPQTGAEILFCYGNAGNEAEWISPAGEGSVIEKEVHIVTLIGNATEVKATLKSGIYATKEEMALKADLDAKASEGGRVLAEQMRFDLEQILYVDAAAAEGGDGSEEKPYKTIQAAVNAFYPGARVVTIKIKAGTYPEAVSITNATGALFLLARNGSGTVTVTSINAQFTNIHISDITVTGGDSGNAVTIANVGNGTLDRVVINGKSTISGVAMYNARCFINSVTINNCDTAVEARDGTFASIRGTAGTGNGVGLASFESIITCTEHAMKATTPYVRQNGGAINVEGGAASFPSNYSQRLNLGDFTDLAALKSAILAEFGKLGIGESRACWFANNIPSGFGIFGTGQRMVCNITKTTDYNGGFGIVIFYSHHYSPCGFMRIQNGAFTSDSPIAFMTQEGGTFMGQISSTGGQNFPAINHTDGAELWLFGKDDTTYKGGFILRAVGPEGNQVTTDLEGKYGSTLKWGGREIVRSVNNILADDLGNVTIPNASSTQYGLIRLASEQDELNPQAAGAALAPANVYKLCDFRLINHSYSVGDTVACAYHADLQLKCTKAGTTSGATLDTSGAKEGQEITDGTVKWSVESIMDKNFVTELIKEAGIVAGDVSNVNAWWVKFGGAVPLMIQGGIIPTSKRTNKTITFPIAFKKCLSVFTQGYVNNSNSSGRGWNVVTTYNNNQFGFYGGFDMQMQNFWYAIGTAN